MIIQPNAIISVSFEGRHDNQQTITVMNYRYMGISTIVNGRPVLDSLLSIIAQPGGLYDTYINTISQDVKDIRPYVQLIAPTRYAYITPGVAGQDGALPGACMPSNTAQTVTRRGEIADRRNISSLHLPGVPVASVTDSTLTPEHMVALLGFATKSVEAIVAAGGVELQPVAYRRVDYGFSRILTEAFVQPTVRVVRRRTVGLGT